MDVKQALVALFGESPLNWAKWAVVFAVLVLGYVAAVPLSKKVDWRRAGRASATLPKAAATVCPPRW